MSILAKLVSFNRSRGDLLPDGYLISPAELVVAIDHQAQVRVIDMRSKEEPRGPRAALPHLARTSGVAPRAGSDNLDYLGLNPVKHAAWMAVMQEFTAQNQSADAQLALRALGDSSKLQAALAEAELEGAGKLRARIEVAGRFLDEMPELVSWWGQRSNAGETGDLRDMVDGSPGPMIATEPSKVARVPQGGTTGAAIVSSQEQSNANYGLPVTPVISLSNATHYLAGLNALIADRRHNVLLGSGRKVYRMICIWSPSGIDAADIQAELDQVMSWDALITASSPAGQLLEASEGYTEAARKIKRGILQAVDEQAEVEIIEVSAPSDRVLFHRSECITAGELARHLAVHHDRADLGDGLAGQAPYPGADWTSPHSYGIWRMLATLDPRAEPGRKAEVRGDDQAELYHHALFGEPIKPGILMRALRRDGVEKGPSRARASLIKLCLLARPGGDMQEDRLRGLDREHPSASYHLGRSLAIASELHRVAVRLQSGALDIGQRTFRLAQDNPLAAVVRLEDLARPHLQKVSKIYPSVGSILGSEWDEAMGKAAGCSRRPSLEEKALLSMGFHQQRSQLQLEKQARFAAADERKQQAKGKQADGSAEQVQEERDE